ncbi:Sensor histidine kinase YpdA [Paraliobacillus sp. PM-2]|uniref:sensor histidine kinase n=1 Tax=Paraliobacillus sp. PM-2 TaxID=1462524 RepID=UPI00061BEA67|nr:sensor histidine kinase [Paraliobacillus sp. PM-2]CQR45852.1 Sensor histidine kinase YpdA [Paraliobacillus sp. PM-2]
MKMWRMGLGRFTHNVFNRLFLISSITIVLTVIILIVTITNYYSDIIIQKEVNINTRTIERVEDYLSDKDLDIKKSIRGLYMKEGMIDHISFALHNGYVKYLEYRLDQFSKDNSFVPDNIETYFNSYFSQDSDLNAISLHSLEDPTIEYLLVNNNIRWHNSIVGNDMILDTLIAKAMPEPKKDSPLNQRKLKNTITIKREINNPVTLQRIGEISFYFSTNRIDRILEKRQGISTSFFLLDANDEIAYSLNKGVPLGILNQIKHETNETELKWKNENYYINTIANKGDYTYISVIPDKGWAKLSIIRGTMWLVIILLIIIAILISYSITFNYSRRIQTIVSVIRQVEERNLDARIPESKHKDELSEIAVNINSMLNELNNYIDQFYLLHMKQQQAELKALQAQIDPHFLFNTLEAIRMVAIVEGSQTSSKMIFHLSKLFRYSLEPRDTVPLYTEIENVSQYLKLMQFKYPNKLDVHFDVPSDAKQTLVQKLILQPIIENYFVHGFKKDRSDNALVIRVDNFDDMIKIIVEDNGKGITEEQLEKIVQYIESEEKEEVRSIGLRNIHQRLKLKYGDLFGLTLQSKEDNGMVVTLSIPKRGDSHV